MRRRHLGEGRRVRAQVRVAAVAAARRCGIGRRLGAAYTGIVMRGKVLRAAGLGPSHWRVVARAYWWLAAVRVLLPLAGFSRTRRLLDGQRPPRPRSGATAPGVSSGAVDRDVWGIEAAASIQPGTPSCLARSMALRRLLRGDGLDGQLQIGVRQESGSGFEAHAWVEIGGEPVGDSPARTGEYTLLSSPEEPRPAAVR